MNRRVAHELLAYGRELEAAGAAQVGDSFSGDAASDALLRRDPNAFLVGILFTQGIPAERAWSAPAKLLERLGSIDPAFLASHPEQVREAVQAPPMLHRFKETIPRWIVSAAQRLVDDYDGDAANLWPPGDTVLEVTRRLSALDGIGRKKAVMAAEILTRHLGVPLRERHEGRVAYDVHVRRVFLRTGLAEKDTVEAIERAACEISPDAPGVLDLPAWLLGREVCRPKAPLCDRCRLATSCPRLISHSPQGVGVRKTK